MGYYHFDRLTALDNTFLAIEDENVHMHVGSVGIFDARPVTLPGGGIDIEGIRALSSSVLHRHPRFRQKLAYVPAFGHPVWVDDARFNLDYHIRHTCLPVPGDIRRLKRLTGRIMSQKLDRGRPLWEMWFVDGVEGDRFAVVTKVHHCMIDGISGVDLMSSLMRVDPKAEVRTPRPWIPRPAPTGVQLLRDELWRRFSLPFSAASQVWHAAGDPGPAFTSVRDGLQGIGQAIAAGLTPAAQTPLNPEIGPHRRFDWTRFDLTAVKRIKKRLGGTVNDVVLACVSGAIRRFLEGRGVGVRDLDFRSMVPVSIRTSVERGTLGNRLSFLVARLPLAERDPRQRLRRVTAETQKLKESKQVRGAELIEQISDWTFDSLFALYARLAAEALSYNMVVTNVPGPQFPVYLLGARMLETYPLVPLSANQALGIALFSYDGGLYWGLNADWDALPDLHDVVEALEAELAELEKAAAETITATPIGAARASRGTRTGTHAETEPAPRRGAKIRQLHRDTEPAAAFPSRLPSSSTERRVAPMGASGGLRRTHAGPRARRTKLPHPPKEPRWPTVPTNV
jgi:WS/DGAT/MGAT family acyltransferase